MTFGFHGLTGVGGFHLSRLISLYDQVLTSNPTVIPQQVVVQMEFRRKYLQNLLHIRVCHRIVSIQRSIRWHESKRNERKERNLCKRAKKISLLFFCFVSSIN